MLRHAQHEDPRRTVRRRALLPALALPAALALLLGARLLLPPPASPALPAAKPGATPPLRVCLYGGFPPFAMVDASGVWTGWEVDYLQGFAKANGLTFKVVMQKDFKDIWLRPGEGKCDIAGGGISDTAARRTATGKGGQWSATYYGVVRAYLIRTADQKKLNGVNDLSGKTVIVTKGSTADDDLTNRLQQANITNVKIQYTPDERIAADKVRNGSAFAYGGGYGSVIDLAKLAKGALAVVWPHCNMVTVDGPEKYAQYAEPFSFVVSAKSGRLAALNTYIHNPSNKYSGTANPDLGCKPPPWVR